MSDIDNATAVKLALMVADGGVAAGPNTATVLAYEVRRLQKIVDGASAVIVSIDASVALLDNMRFDAPVDGCRPFAAAAAVGREVAKELRKAGVP